MAADLVAGGADPAARTTSLSVRLVTWGYLNFTVQAPLTMRIAEVRDRIAARHGGSVGPKDITLYKHNASSRNIIKEMMCTLEELDIGTVAVDDDDKAPECTIFYDLKPQCDCPLVLAEPVSCRFTREARNLVQAEEERRAKHDRPRDQRGGIVRAETKAGNALRAEAPSASTSGHGRGGPVRRSVTLAA